LLKIQAEKADRAQPFVKKNNGGPSRPAPQFAALRAGHGKLAWLHAIWHIKPCLFAHDSVANPRDAADIRCGLRLAPIKNS
jgi:hypothetical protein